MTRNALIETPYDVMPQDMYDLLKKAQDIKSVRPDTAQKSIGLIDHTSLQDGIRPMIGAETEEKIQDFCENALAGGNQVAAICVYPNHAATVATAVKESGVEIAAVNNFPHGHLDTAEAAEQALDAIKAGATEIDTVIDYEAYLAGDMELVDEKLKSVAEICHTHNAALKIILKAGIYPDYDTLYSAAQTACAHCRDGDFVKTCTGKPPKDGFGEDGVPDASTLPAGLTVMKAVADYNAGHGTTIGVKISGGVKTALDCERYRFLAENIMDESSFTPERFRFGASSLIGNLRAELDHGNDDIKQAAKAAKPSSSY